jgi:hypothetical protein
LRLQAEAVVDRVSRGRWNSLTYFAHPGYAPEGDVYGKSLWEACVPVTSNLTSMVSVHVSMPMIGEPATVSTYVWNSGTWRLIQITRAITVGHGKLSCVVELGKVAVMDRPVLVTATDGETLHWGLTTPSKDEQSGESFGRNFPSGRKMRKIGNRFFDLLAGCQRSLRGLAVLWFLGGANALGSGYYDPTAFKMQKAYEYLEEVEKAIGQEAFEELRHDYAMDMALRFGPIDRFSMTPEIFAEHVKLTESQGDLILKYRVS